MFCQKCGAENGDSSGYCVKCGSVIKVVPQKESFQNDQTMKHTTPKCTHCGYIGEWKLGPLFRPVDAIGFLFLLLGVFPGIIYFAVVGVIRSNKDNREKVCPQCHAKNLWTFLY